MPIDKSAGNPPLRAVRELYEQKQKRVFTPEEVAGEIGVHSDTVYALLQGRRLPHVKIGRRYFIPIKAFEEWLMRESEESVA